MKTFWLGSEADLTAAGEQTHQARRSLCRSAMVR